MSSIIKTILNARKGFYEATGKMPTALYLGVASYNQLVQATTSALVKSELGLANSFQGMHVYLVADHEDHIDFGFKEKDE